MVYRQLGSVRRFTDLIPFRVREVLLVSSPYDYFILQEDGPLTQRVFLQYQEFNLTNAPRFTFASNAVEALAKLSERRFDLVLVMTSAGRPDVSQFGHKVKQRWKIPVVLLSLDQREQGEGLPVVDPEAIDGVFVWTGDSGILLSIVKYVEDRYNVEHDVRVGNVRVILMVEDSPRYYTKFLRVLYSRLMKLSQSLYSEGQAELYRLAYMRSRPKLVHATSYEEGLDKFHQFQNNLFALITDVRIPRGGRIDARAGLDLAMEARRLDPHLPILLQSAETEHREEAEKLGAAFVDKNSHTLLADLESFLDERLGFDDFIFRLPDGTEVGRARDLRELEQKLEDLPAESLLYHAQRNHFSLWLMARSEFDLAEELRPQKVEDFADVEAMRHHIINAMREARESMHGGTVADFNPDRVGIDNLVRIGSGSLGGKALGIAFLNKLLSEREWSSGTLPVVLPKTVFITTEFFDRFLELNQLGDFVREEHDDEDIAQRFQESRLDETLKQSLREVVQHFETPLAVRSSSLLEDSLHQPFAGIYATLMIPNDDPDIENRLKDLCAAIKMVYASTFFRDAKSYLKSTGGREEEEKMAVVVQELVGRRRPPRYYPSFSGVAQSYNFYPVGPQRAEDGVVLVALGLGSYIVEGGMALRFSPRHPQVMPQLGAIRSFVESSQRQFHALNLEVEGREPGKGLESVVRTYDLKAAEEDGALLPLASVYSTQDEQIRDDLSLPGPRVITFNNILKHKAIPLAETLCQVLDMVEQGIGGPCEVEFACEMGDWGGPIRRGTQGEGPRLYLLQLRPLEVAGTSTEAADYRFHREDQLCVSQMSLGNGVISNIQDVLFVRRETWEPRLNQQIASEIASFNRLLEAEQRPFILIGPGRWGSADRFLGIPVQWSQISGARLIVEASPAGYEVAPSQGTHFFQNITALGIGYLTIPPGADEESGKPAFVDWTWLEAQPVQEQTEHVSLVHFDRPLTVVLDGRAGRAVVAKPEAEPIAAGGEEAVSATTP